MALYERLIGNDDAGNRVGGRIPPHGFSATMGEFARGRINGAQAQAAIEAMSGLPLDAGEVAEAQTLLGTITNAGNATAKLARAKEIDDVLMLGELGAPAYDTPSEIKARLGV